MYAVYSEIRDKKGLKDSDVAKGTGVSKQILSNWKIKGWTPKVDKLQKIADFLGVSIDYLLTGEEPESYSYFLDPEVAKMAQEIHDNEGLKILFDTTRKVSKEDLQIVIDVAKRIFRND